VRQKNDSWEDVQTAAISGNRIVDIYMLKPSYYKPGFYLTGFKKKNSENRELFYADDSGMNIYSINGSPLSGDEISICELNKRTLIVSSNANGIDGSYDFYLRKVSEILKKASPSTFYLNIENKGYDNPDGIKIKVLYFTSMNKNAWPEKSEIMTPDNSGSINLIAEPDVKRILVLPGESDMKLFNVEFLTANDSISTATIKIEPSQEKEFIIKPVYYEFNSCEIHLKDIPYIHELINYLRENADIKISIEGYSDGTGSYRSNLDISLKRAEKLRDYLIREGISKDRIETKGHGYIKDKGPDTSQYNRRVEFNLTQQ
jgi:outer membrane protein OmpA-like peptidoglycan-associated protein